MVRPPIERARPTAGNLAILAAGEILTRGLTFLAFAYLGRILAPSHFGFLGSVYAVLMFGTVIADQGLGLLGTREIARDPRAAPEITRKVVSIQFWLASATVLLLLAGSWALPLEPALARLIAGFSVSLLGAPFLVYWVFQGLNRMLWSALPMALRQATFLALALLLVHRPGDLLLLPLAEIGAVLAAAACTLTAYLRHCGPLRWRWVSDLDGGLLRQALPIGLSQLIWAVRMYLPVLAVLSTLGASAAGHFESAHRIVMVFQALLGVYFINLFPGLSATSHHAGEELGGMLRRSVGLSAGLTAGLAAAMLFLAPAALRIVFGERYVTPEGVHTLAALSWIVPVLACRRNGRAALIALDLQRRELECSLAGAALFLAAIVPMTRILGIAGAAWAMVGSELAATALTWAVLAPHLRSLKSSLKRGRAA